MRLADRSLFSGFTQIQPSVHSKSSKLKSELIIAQDKAAKLRDSIASFRINEQYHQLEREATTLSRQIAHLSDENVIDARYISELEASQSEEVPPPTADLEAIYEQVGVLFPEIVRVRFKDAERFHASVVKNRQSYLASEITSARYRILERNREKASLDARRAEVMTILRAEGALEELAALQGEHARAEALVETLRQRFEAASTLETGEARLRLQRAVLLERLILDHQEQNSLIESAIILFHEISSALYSEELAGTLAIRPTENGPEFDPHLPAESSKGINNMRVFCFDMMLMVLLRKRGCGLDFLIHDSHLFDGVDERQAGKALWLGSKLANEHGFQYIVTLNSDDIPRELPEGFDPMAFALPVRLTDAVVDGGLFGFRFD